MLATCSYCDSDSEGICESHCFARKDKTCKYPDEDEMKDYKCTLCPRRWHKRCVGFSFVETNFICPVCVNKAQRIVTLYKNSEELHKCLCEEFTPIEIAKKVLPQIVRSVKVNKVPTPNWDQLSPDDLLALDKPDIRIDIEVVNTKPTPWEGYTALHLSAAVYQEIPNFAEINQKTYVLKTIYRTTIAGTQVLIALTDYTDHCHFNPDDVKMNAPKGTAFIAFPGTKSLECILKDVLAYKTENLTKGGLHAGFNKHAQLVNHEIIMGLVEAGYRVILTGHSLGAAAPLIRTLDCITMMDDVKKQDLLRRGRLIHIGFATPLAVSNVCASAIQRNRWDEYFTSYILKGDPVPRLLAASLDWLAVDISKLPNGDTFNAVLTTLCGNDFTEEVVKKAFEFMRQKMADQLRSVKLDYAPVGTYVFLDEVAHDCVELKDKKGITQKLSDGGTELTHQSLLCHTLTMSYIPKFTELFAQQGSQFQSFATDEPPIVNPPSSCPKILSEESTVTLTLGAKSYVIVRLTGTNIHLLREVLVDIKGIEPLHFNKDTQYAGKSTWISPEQTIFQVETTGHVLKRKMNKPTRKIEETSCTIKCKHILHDQEIIVSVGLKCENQSFWEDASPFDTFHSIFKRGMLESTSKRYSDCLRAGLELRQLLKREDSLEGIIVDVPTVESLQKGADEARETYKLLDKIIKDPLKLEVQRKIKLRNTLFLVATIVYSVVRITRGDFDLVIGLPALWESTNDKVMAHAFYKDRLSFLIKAFNRPALVDSAKTMEDALGTEEFTVTDLVEVAVFVKDLTPESQQKLVDQANLVQKISICRKILLQSPPIIAVTGLKNAGKSTVVSKSCGLPPKESGAGLLHATTFPKLYPLDAAAGGIKVNIVDFPGLLDPQVDHDMVSEYFDAALAAIICVRATSTVTEADLDLYRYLRAGGQYPFCPKGAHRTGRGRHVVFCITGVDVEGELEESKLNTDEKVQKYVDTFVTTVNARLTAVCPPITKENVVVVCLLDDKRQGRAWSTDVVFDVSKLKEYVKNWARALTE
eukprot:PhF_6_TR26683/c1_g1_i1/m.38842